MKNIKYILAASLIGIAILIAFALPKPKYQGINILKQINIPKAFGQWTSKDVSQTLNINDQRFNFISGILARAYTRSDGASLLLLILDAGNFHNPKVCFGSSGYKITELEDQKIEACGRSIKATTLFADKSQEGYVLMYWLCIDKQITSWTGQKTKELFTSITGKKKAGLMVRLDIPVNPQSPESSVTLGQQFLTEFSTHLSQQDLTFIFRK